MRYHDLFDAQQWRKYPGRDRECTMSPTDHVGPPVRVLVQQGSVLTGRQRVWVGYFCKVIDSNGESWLSEHPHSLRGALLDVEAKLEIRGWKLDVIGTSEGWYESGLSENSGYGFHAQVDGAAHMLDPWPSATSAGDDKGRSDGRGTEV